MAEYKLTFVFDDEDLMQDFAAYMSDGGGEGTFVEWHEKNVVFDYHPTDGRPRNGETFIIDRIVRVTSEDRD
jgi:hypothetical protein